MRTVVSRQVPLVTGVLTIVSLALVVGAVTGAIPTRVLPGAPDWLVAAIPHVNALLSLVAIATILRGLYWIRLGRIDRHRRSMLTALGLFATFLLLYLYRVSVHGPTAFGGPQSLYTYLYLPLLGVHMLLAIVCIPLLYYVLLLALTRPVAELRSSNHPRVGRVAAPLWLTSFLLGFIVYVLLYWAY